MVWNLKYVNFVLSTSFIEMLFNLLNIALIDKRVPDATMTLIKNQLVEITVIVNMLTIERVGHIWLKVIELDYMN